MALRPHFTVGLPLSGKESVLRVAKRSPEQAGLHRISRAEFNQGDVLNLKPSLFFVSGKFRSVKRVGRTLTRGIRGNLTLTHLPPRGGRAVLASSLVFGLSKLPPRAAGRSDAAAAGWGVSVVLGIETQREANCPLRT